MKEDFEEIQVVDFKKPKKAKKPTETSSACLIQPNQSLPRQSRPKLWWIMTKDTQCCYVGQ